MKKRSIAIALNITIVILEVIGLIMCIKNEGIGLLKYYTEDSNIIALISSILFVVYALKGNYEKLPKWLNIFRLLATTSLSLTFLVVLFILGPNPSMGGYTNMMFKGSMFIQHTLCPLLLFISYVFFEKANITDRKDIVLSQVLTLVYAIILISLNALKIVDGPYPFLKIYSQSMIMSFVWVLCIIGTSYLTSYLISKLNVLMIKK